MSNDQNRWPAVLQHNQPAQPTIGMPADAPKLRNFRPMLKDARQDARQDAAPNRNQSIVPENGSSKNRPGADCSEMPSDAQGCSRMLRDARDVRRFNRIRWSWASGGWSHARKIRSKRSQSATVEPKAERYPKSVKEILKKRQPPTQDRSKTKSIGCKGRSS